MCILNPQVRGETSIADGSEEHGKRPIDAGPPRSDVNADIAVT
jgi:hypothetical protein